MERLGGSDGCRGDRQRLSQALNPTALLIKVNIVTLEKDRVSGLDLLVFCAAWVHHEVDPVPAAIKPAQIVQPVRLFLRVAVSVVLLVRYADQRPFNVARVQLPRHRPNPVLSGRYLVPHLPLEGNLGGDVFGGDRPHVDHIPIAHSPQSAQ